MRTREVDKIIHQIVGIEHNNCPDMWKEVKKRITDNKEGFVTRLEEEWSKHA